MSKTDPPRWLDGGGGAPSELQALLRAGKDELPDAGRLARIGAALGPDFEPPGGSHASGAESSNAAAPGAVGASTGTGALIKAPWLGLAALVALGAFTAALVLQADDGTDPGSTPDRPHEAPLRSAVQPPGAPEPEQQQQQEQEQVQEQVQEQEPARVPGPAPEPPAEPPTKSDRVTPPDELELLDRGQAALRSEPALALRLAQRHARAHPNGVFAQERERIAIEALIALGRSTEARERGERFLSHYPGSSHARQVAALLDRLATEALQQE